MPIYEYTCQGCGEDFELLVLSKDAKSACPSCGSKKLTKRFSTFAAHQAAGDPTCGGGACPASKGRSPCSSGKCPFSG